MPDSTTNKAGAKTNNRRVPMVASVSLSSRLSSKPANDATNSVIKKMGQNPIHSASMMSGIPINAVRTRIRRLASPEPVALPALCCELFTV